MAAHGVNEVELRDLSAKHKQVAALLAQGMGRGEISQLVDYTPEYVTWLMRDPSFKAYMVEMSEVADVRLEALFSQVPDVIARGMQAERVEDQLKAARLQLEVTKRLGNGGVVERRDSESSLARLEVLAERLLALNSRGRVEVIDVEAT